MNSSYRIQFQSFSITVRELLVSFIILAVLIVIGICISDNIKANSIEKEEKYLKAYKLDSDTDMWNYLVETEIGAILAKGEAKISTPVTMDNIGGEYWSITRLTQHYIRHTKEVRHERQVGKRTEVYYTTKVYYSWDTIASNKLQGTKFTFLGKEYDVGSLGIYRSESYITTVQIDGHNRYVYYGASPAAAGVLYTEIYNGHYNNCQWFSNSSIESIVSRNEGQTTAFIFCFWLFYGMFIVLIICLYIYKDNEYLED